MARIASALLAATLTLGLSTPLWAADTKAEDAPAATDLPAEAPTIEAARAAIEAEDFAGAARILAVLTGIEPNNADVWNLFGFASRKMGQMGAASQAYEMALQLDPKHLDALEYQGEMFVELKRPEDAQKNLATLKALCGDCEQATDLDAAIAAAPAGEGAN